MNLFQIERFTRFVGHDIIIFPAQHNRIKREREKTILQKDSLSIQDEDYRAIDPGLLYYYKSMLVVQLTNMYTTLDMVNGARFIIYRIII